MERANSFLETISDDALVIEVARLAMQERQATAKLIDALGEFDDRRLYLPAGCSSLFTYCTQVLHLSEGAAYNRIEAARAARRFPAILERLAAGDLTLTGVRLLAPHLTAANQVEVLEAARHRSKRELEDLIAALRPRPDAPSLIRKLPAMAGAGATAPALAQEARAEPPTDKRTQMAGTASEALRKAVVVAVAVRPSPAIAPLAPARYKVQFTMSRETHDKLRRAQDLLRHAVPDGDLAEVFNRALSLLLADLEKRKLAAATRPRRGGAAAACAPRRSRHIPAAVRREVWARDGGQCAYVGTNGRCRERGFLEFHHRVPFADSGASTVENLELRCRTHNQYEAERWDSTAQPARLLRETGAGYRSAGPCTPRCWT